jgi:hypothetical protein
VKIASLSPVFSINQIFRNRCRAVAGSIVDKKKFIVKPILALSEGSEKNPFPLNGGRLPIQLPL